MRWLLIVFDLALILAFSACATLRPFADPPYRPTNPHDSLSYVVQYRPPPVYRQWWDEIRNCAHVEHPAVAFEQVRWYLVGAVIDLGGRPITTPSFQVGGQWVYGAHDFPRVVNVLISAPMVMDAAVVRHEMLHVITSPTQYGGHPDSLFKVGPCAPLVYRAGDAPP